MIGIEFNSLLFFVRLQKREDSVAALATWDEILRPTITNHIALDQTVLSRAIAGNHCLCEKLHFVQIIN